MGLYLKLINLQLLIKSLEDSLQSLIVPAILESTCDPTAASISKPLDSLIGQLDKIYNLLDGYGLELSVTFQIFKQLFYYICAGALNNLLLRRELCHWSKGVDIRFNISGLQVGFLWRFFWGVFINFFAKLGMDSWETDAGRHIATHTGALNPSESNSTGSENG